MTDKTTRITTLLALIEEANSISQKVQARILEEVKIRNNISTPAIISKAVIGSTSLVTSPVTIPVTSTGYLLSETVVNAEIDALGIAAMKADASVDLNLGLLKYDEIDEAINFFRTVDRADKMPRIIELKETLGDSTYTAFKNDIDKHKRDKGKSSIYKDDAYKIACHAIQRNIIKLYRDNISIFQKTVNDMQPLLNDIYVLVEKFVNVHTNTLSNEILKKINENLTNNSEIVKKNIDKINNTHKVFMEKFDSYIDIYFNVEDNTNYKKKLDEILSANHHLLNDKDALMITETDIIAKVESIVHENISSTSSSGGNLNRIMFTKRRKYKKSHEKYRYGGRRMSHKK